MLENYLAASLGSKALILCFAGQKPELNSKGYCSKIVAWNDQALAVRYLGVDGEPILRGGFFGYRIQDEDGEVYTTWLDIKGRDVRCCSSNEWFLLDYDASDRAVRKTYCNCEWKPTAGEDGVLFQTYEYDENGNVTSLDCFGSMSNRVLCADGSATVKSRYNKRGQEVWRRFYGEAEEPVILADGHAGFDVVYDKNGHQRKFVFVGCDGKPIMTRQGYAIEERKYNERGLEVERAWYDVGGKLVCVGGAAKILKDYDKVGNLTELAHFGADNRLVRNENNVAIARWTCDQFGQVVDCHYYDQEGKPTLHRDGCASWRNDFDAAGRIVGRKYFDGEGNEIDLNCKREKE